MLMQQQPSASELKKLNLMSTIDYEQALIERKADYEAQTKQLSSMNKAQQYGREADTNYGSRIVHSKTAELAAALESFYEEQALIKRRRHTTYRLLKGQLDSETVAFLALKTVINGISGKALVSYLAEKIGAAVEDEIMMRLIEKNEKSAFNRITAAIARKGQLHRKVRTAKYIAEKDGIAWKEWEKRERFLIGKTLVELIVTKVGLIDCVKQSTYVRGVRKTTNKLIATPATLAWIKEAGEAAALLAPKYTLMIRPPLEWTNSTSGGYLTDYLRPITLVKQGSVNRKGMKNFLAELDSVEMPLVYKAINRAQNVKWKIDVETLELLESLAETDSELGGLPPINALPLPPKPADIDDNADSRLKWRRAAAKVYEENTAIASKRCALLTRLKEARQFAKYSAVYAPFTADFRGRLYAVPTLNCQGADYTKALLKFADGKPLGTTGVRWLAINIANLFGFDKQDFDTREMWTHLHSDDLVKCAADPYTHRLWCDADKPFLFLQAIREWAGYLEEGEDFVSHIPIALDGSCSGLQNFGMALRCEDTGNEVNLTPKDVPADIYQTVIDKVQKKLEVKIPKWRTMSQSDAESDAKKLLRDTCATKETHLFTLLYEEALAPFYDAKGNKVEKSAEALAMHKQREEYLSAFSWLKFGLTRKVAKRCVMTFPYGSKAFGFRDQLMEDIVDKTRREQELLLESKKITRAEFEEVYPFIHVTGYQAAGHMARWLYESVTKTVVKAAEAMEWLQKAAKLVAKGNRPVLWTTPLGFPVRQHYHKTKKEFIKTSFLGMQDAKFVMRKATDDVDARKQAASVAPNFIHALDSTHLMLVTARCELDNLALIHDSFGTLACDTDHLFKVLREEFYNLYTEVDVFQNFQEEVLQQIAEADRDKLPPLPSKGTLDLSLVKESLYCFA